MLDESKHASRQIGSGQTGDGKNEHRHSRNQQTKMDCSDDHFIYYHEYIYYYLRRNGVAIIVNKRFRNAVIGCNLKNDKMISVHFQGKSFNIRIIQVYAPTTNAEEAEVEWFYEELQDLLEPTRKKDARFIKRAGMQK